MAEELFKDNEYAQAKVKKAINILYKTYYAGSELAKIVTVEDATNIENEVFLQLGSRHLVPKEWFTRTDIVIDVVFDQFARNLVISEEKVLLERIFRATEIPKLEISENIIEDFILQFREFSKNQKVDTLLIPIDFYVGMHTDWLTKTPDIKMDFTSGELTICETKPHIFWSNKYTPFDDLVLINKHFAKWTSKPNFENRLEVKISKSDKEDQLNLIYLTKFKLELIDPTKALILHKMLMKTE